MWQPGLGSEWRVPGFTEIRELGVGGQGRAVLVQEDASGRPAVVKYVVTAGDAVAQERFRQESVLLKRIHSPYVARWYGHFEDASVSAILMEAVSGVSLQEVLVEHRALLPEAALLVLKGSLLGLAASHELGVVHRDYKPANVIVQSDGLSKLIDFGVATLTGEVSRSGTPAYMAPEQWQGSPASPATDVYAATCVFFECITGNKPYQADGLPALMAQHLTGTIPVEEVPDGLHGLVTRGLAKMAEERPPSATAFVTELEAAASTAYGEDWESRGLAALATAAAALAALFPLAALVVPGASSTVGHTAIGHTALSAGNKTGKGLLTKMGAAKAAVAVAGAVVIGAVATVIVTSGSHVPKPPKSPVIAVDLASYSKTFPTDGLIVRDAPYPRITGIQDPRLAQMIDQALRAPLDEQIAAYRGGIATNGSPECRKSGSKLGVTVSLGLRGPTLVSARYQFREDTKCWQSGAFNESVNVNLRTGRTLRPSEIFRPGTLDTPQELRRLNQMVTQHWVKKRSCEILAPLSHDTLEKKTGLTGVETDLTLMPDHLEVTSGVTTAEGCIGGPISLPYAAIRDQLSNEILALLPH
jgi:hypothetical protein